MKEQENKPKVIFETIVCYQGVKFNTVLKITAKELIFKKQKLFSDKYKTVLRVLINDIIVILFTHVIPEGLLVLFRCSTSL